MCTAVAYKVEDFYFGRTLDSEIPYYSEVVFTPRRFVFDFHFEQRVENHYGILGMAYVCDGYPLYFDAMNEKGLAAAGLSFAGNAVYRKPTEDKTNIASFELIPYILSLCDSVDKAKTLLENINITDTAFSDNLPCAQLHWIIADEKESITVESVADGVKVYENKAGVLTNNPPFPTQMKNYEKFLHLNPNHKELKEDAKTYTSFTRGTGAIGLPGDYTSQSRFVRAAFVKRYSECESSHKSCVNQFFHILDSVIVPRGCCITEKGEVDLTRYVCCMSASQKAYYCKTYENNTLYCVAMDKENFNSADIVRYPLAQEEIIAVN